MLKNKPKRISISSSKKLSLIGMTKLMIYLMKIGQIETPKGINPNTKEGEETVKQYLIDSGYKGRT